MIAWTIFFVCLSLFPIAGTGRIVVPFGHARSPARSARIVKNYGELPLGFEANQDQVNPQVKFVSRGPGYDLFLTTTEAVLSLRKNPKLELGLHATNAVQPRDEQSTVLRLNLVGANRRVEVVGQDELPGKSNYFIGNDPKKWQTNVRQYAKVRYPDVYPGVDLVYYGNQRELEFDFLVQPGTDPGVIRLAIEGASKLRLDEGDLLLNSAGGEVRLRCPHVYQVANGRRVEIPTRYSTKDGNEVEFQLASYDRRLPLVIDPVLSYSTYLGGSSNDVGVAIAADSEGNAYVTGYTSSSDFPIANALQPTLHGGFYGDAFVTKIDADGNALVYSTFLGGSSDDAGQAIALDSTGNVYLTGWTASTDFPTVNPIQATLHGGRNAFVAKINAAGNALVYSTYLGGGEDYGWGIAVDSAGNAHVGGDTRSHNFPVVHPIQGTLRSILYFNSFVSEISADGRSLIYSTYLGGTVAEGGSRVAVDAAGNTYIAGYTSSPDFPIVNAIQPVFGGVRDAYLTKINAQGTALVYSTFIGGSDDDLGIGLALDSAGNAYVSGGTRSTDFPTANPFQSANRGGYDAFLTKINAQGNAILCSSYLGGSSDEYGSGIASDSSGSAYVGGQTSSADFPIVDAIQPNYGGNNDYFVTKIDTDACAIVYSTYLGGSANEGYWQFFGITADAVGNAYVTGFSQSTDFPTTPGAFQQGWKGGSDSIVAKIASVPPVPVKPAVKLQPSNQTVMDGSSVSFKAAASGTPSPTVQWQVSTNGGATFGNIAGATATTLTFTAALAQNGNQYRAVFTNTAGSATTNAATLTVTPIPPCVKNLTGMGVSSGSAPARIDLSWSGMPNVASYNVLRGVTPGGPYQLIGNTAGTAYSDRSGLANNKTYDYVLQPVNGTGTKICQSNQAIITIPAGR